MNFEQLVSLCQRTHEELLARASRTVDAHLVIRNWILGQYIAEFEQSGADRAEYGARLLERLSERLKPLKIKGTSATRLKLYRAFYRLFPIRPTVSDPFREHLTDPSAIRPTASDLSHSSTLPQTRTFLAEIVNAFPLGWSHYVELLTLADTAERRFYEIEAAANQWTVRELQRQIATSLHQRLALSRDKEEIRRLATEGQVVEKAADFLPAPTARSKKAADLLPAPTVRSKQAQGIALGDNPKMIQALKGRPKPCHNHSPVFTSTSSSAPRIVNDSSPTISAILSMPTWQPSCKIGAVPRCSSILSKTMFTSCSIWHAPSPSAPRSRRSKKPRRNGSRPRAQRLPVSPGRPDMARLPYPSRTFQPCGITSPDNKSITGRSHSKTNTEPSWCDTELISMNDMSGINAPPWAAPSGLHSLSSARPRALPSFLHTSSLVADLPN